MKHLRNILVPLTLFFFLSCGNLYALDKYYLLEQGKQAQDKGLLGESITLYKKYIDSHPATLGKSGQGYNKNKQYYLRNLIIAYDNMLDQLADQGNSAEIESLITKLINTHHTNKFGAKNTYKVGLILLNHDLETEAASLFETIIADPQKNQLPYNNKVILRAYSKLLELSYENGDLQQIDTLVGKLKADYPSASYDLHDNYALANLLDKFDTEAGSSTQILEKILDDYSAFPDSGNIHVAVKTFSKLMKKHHADNDIAAKNKLITNIYRKHFTPTVSANILYKLAITFLNTGNEGEGEDILKNLVENQPFTVQAKKALFVLGRRAQSKEKWDEAISYYSDYTTKYPDVPFFSLKAYSKLLDSHWSRDGNLNFIESEMNHLADIVNDVSDYDTILNLSREMHLKGHSQLAASTFSLGLAKANEHINANRNTYEELRARWQIEKYAYDHEQPEIVEENASRILELADTLSRSSVPKKQKKKIKYIKGQTRFWLARVAKDENRFVDSESQLIAFTSENPSDPDVDYALYMLGNVYEEQKIPAKAMDSYKQVKKGVWKEKANKKIIELENLIAN